MSKNLLHRLGKLEGNDPQDPYGLRRMTDEDLNRLCYEHALEDGLRLDLPLAEAWTELADALEKRPATGNAEEDELDRQIVAMMWEEIQDGSLNAYEPLHAEASRSHQAMRNKLNPNGS